VLVGAKTLMQLEQNLKALEVVGKITPEVKSKIDALMPLVPQLDCTDQTVIMRSRYLWPKGLALVVTTPLF
ncbi:hypothetical protein JM16_009214, partial [Phytophthora kernoviae]